MNSDTLKGQWLQLKGEVKRQWGKLTDDDITLVNGDMEKLAGVIQERYGYARERAQEEIARWQAEQKSTTRP